MSAVASAQRAELRRRLSMLERGDRDAWLVGFAVLVFIGVSVWWLGEDTRVPDFDSGTHLMYALEDHAAISSGKLTFPFTTWNTYPPFVHLMGAFTAFVAGESTHTIMLGANVIFVPLLAFGCYGVGQLVYGRRAGLLAALFGLGTPMFVSMMHEYDLDTPQAAMVAVSVWAVLASRHFQRLGTAALAGLLCGLALLTKETTIIFLGGFLAVVFLRGGWRNWRGLLLFLSVFAAIAAPWYVYHASEVRAAIDSVGNAAPNAVQSPPRWTGTNLAWYFWNFLNEQALGPLTALTIVGIGAGIVSSWRSRQSSNLIPELLGGLAVSYLGMTYLMHKDPRYTLPALVYAATLGTGWITQLRSVIWRNALSVGVVVVALINFIGLSVGIGHPVRLALPGAENSIIFRRQITFYSPDGWVRGGPEHDGNVLALMQQLRRYGIRTLEVGSGAERLDFNQQGIVDFATTSGLTVPFPFNPSTLGATAAEISLRVPQPQDPPPCQRLSDGSGVYVSVGDAALPFEKLQLLCPTRHPALYRRTAPLPGTVVAATTTEITGPARPLLEGVFRALHRQGLVREIEFDASGQNVAFFAPIGMTQLAAAADLKVSNVYNPPALGPRDALIVRRLPAPGDPPPCGRFPDGSGLYVVLGAPAPTFPQNRFDCPRGR